MASISGLSGSAAGGASSIRGFGGLASGLDRDTLIENMTAATRSKIAQQKQKKETLGWKQTAMRGLTTQMHEFTSKYTSYTSSSNLSGGKNFSRTQITASGANSKYLSVSGAATGADTLTVLGVKQLAKNAQATTGAVSDKKLSTGNVALDASGQLSAEAAVSTVAGGNLLIKYGNKDYYVTLNEGKEYDYSTTESTAKALNDIMKTISIGNDKTLADVVKVEVSKDAADVSTGKLKLTNTDKSGSGNSIVLAGGSKSTLENLGFMSAGENFQRVNITSEGNEAKNAATVTEMKSMADIFSEKEMCFTYNGTTKWVTLGKFEKTDTPEKIEADLQKKLDEAFGKNRVEVNAPKATDNKSFSFEFNTVKPVKQPDGTYVNKPDESSTLAIAAASRGLTGNMGILGIQNGESNRLNMSADIMGSGLKGLAGITSGDWTEFTDANGKQDFKLTDGLTINGKSIEIKKSDSINDIINRINSSEAGVTVSYQSNSDSFTITSKEKGASGSVDISGKGASLLFDDNSIKEYGQDAIIAVKYAGAVGETEVTRDSNTITVDGLNITVKGTFGYVADASSGALIRDPASEEVTFDASVDTEKTTKAVKEMVEDYNKILEAINKEVSQKPNRDYQPLTDEQREAMSDSQIEKWETEAQKGLFFNDNDLRSLLDNIRFVLPTQDKAALSKMGITTSTDYSDNGKLVFNEVAFETALKTDPESVKEVFTRESSMDAEGKTIEGGLITKMKTVMDRYASMTGTPKGVLVERSGSIYAPTTILTNSFQKQMDELDDYITTLTRKLVKEQDRYISQFTSMENLISQMNSQSSSLSGFFSS